MELGNKYLVSCNGYFSDLYDTFLLLYICRRISRHFREIRNIDFLFFTKWLPAAILDDFPILDHRKSFLIAFLAILDQYATFNLFTKWIPAAILDDRSHFSPFQINTPFLFCSQNGCRLPFWMTNCISRHFRSIRNFNFCSQNGCQRPFWMTENHF